MFFLDLNLPFAFEGVASYPERAGTVSLQVREMLRRNLRTSHEHRRHSFHA